MRTGEEELEPGAKQANKETLSVGERRAITKAINGPIVKNDHSNLLFLRSYAISATSLDIIGKTVEWLTDYA